MKTSMIMNRDLMGITIRQDSLNKMFNANDLLIIGNLHRVDAGLSRKQMGSFFDLDSTKELINAICLEENICIEKVKMSKKGRHGGTWLHPILFVDMAMWYSPFLKVKILSWVIDGLLGARNDSGDSFKKMCSALSDNFEKEMSVTLMYSRIANRIAGACKVGTQKDKWETASEEQLHLRDKIQENIYLLADVAPNIGTCINKAITKALESTKKL